MYALGGPAGPAGQEHQLHRGEPVAAAGGAGLRLQQRKHCEYCRYSFGSAF
jgi:hypothetical protein